MSSSKPAWPQKSIEGRWCSFGPYYAMFPVNFVRKAVEKFTRPGEMVLDPFCGRGTVPFVSQALGRFGVGIDLNPVGWIFASVKTDPYPQADTLYQRLKEVSQDVEPRDKHPENEFQAWAWCSDVLGFLNAARRVLNWRGSKLDRTLMGFILVHLHSKLGEGLSNQLRQSKAMAPDYSVQWWKARQMTPPDIAPVECLQKKIERRYALGILEKPAAQVLLGDARTELDKVKDDCFNFLLTSPPYCGVTNYRYDNWIRIWMLGGPPLPEGGHQEKYRNRTEYINMLKDVFSKSANLLHEAATIYVRTDARTFTRSTTLAVLSHFFPHHFKAIRDEQVTNSQTQLFGDKSIKCASGTRV